MSEAEDTSSSSSFADKSADLIVDVKIGAVDLIKNKTNVGVEDLFTIFGRSDMKLLFATLAGAAWLSGASAGIMTTDGSEATKFKHFVALNSSKTCFGDEHARPFNNQIRGVSLGGWMVLEPWITPSMFYQFLGKGEGEVAFDTYTFCEVLGTEEANKQLRRHWDSWVTKEIIQELANSGAVNSLRLPIGDYMYKPYGPYAGCFEGALEKVEEVLDWAYEMGLSVLLDVHTIKDSQNGFDNSGQAMGFKWTTELNSEFAGDVSFQHWPIRSANWMGEFDPETASYPKINKENIQHALDVVSAVVAEYSGHPAVLGIEPLNEPWQYTPIEELKRFYWEGYLIVKKEAPYWKYIMHDSFRFDTKVWGGFMSGCPERALDTHIYQAWRDPDSRIGFYQDACSQKRKIAKMEQEFGPVIVGEWSLATDNCAMWLNGFNDNLPGFPRLPCKYIPCADPYMGEGQPGTPVDNTKPIQGPFGTGMSGPHFGLCPVGRDWLREASGNPQTGRDWVRTPPDAPKHYDDTDNVMTHLALKKINAFSGIGHGFYFWNFRTDLDEPRWSYMLALKKGWIPSGNLNDEKINNACWSEDRFEYKCVLKRDVSDKALKDVAGFILESRNKTGTNPPTQADYDILEMEGSELSKNAAVLVTDYFESHKTLGATCDFGGIAMLVEVNRTITDDDSLGFDDDEYYFVVHEGPNVMVIALIAALCVLFGSVVGFLVSMHCNKKFNEKVRKSKYFKRVNSSQNSLVRRSFALPNIENSEELEKLLRQQDEPGKNNAK
eukprot:scaffold8740_cov113-Cylindrotheca_fusiformis.AAC.4